MAGFMTGNHILRNISYQTIPGSVLVSLYEWTDRAVAQSDQNLYFQASDGKYVLEDQGRAGADARFSFGQWQAMGHDAHSRLEDPMFIDPASDDYRLRPESPAFQLGFTPIDLSKIGLRERGATR